MKTAIVFVALAIVFFLDTSQSISCYECTFCKTPKNLITCPSDKSHCYTYVTTIGAKIAWRGCSDENRTYCENNFSFKDHEGVKKCTCDSDGCNNEEYNSAFKALPSALGLLSLALAYIIA